MHPIFPSGRYFRFDGSGTSFSDLVPEDLPTASANRRGAVLLALSASDVQPLGTPDTGSAGRVADVAHVHPTTGVATVDSNGTLQARFGIRASVTTVATSYHVRPVDHTVLLDASGIAVTLPAAAVAIGRVYTLKLIASGSTATVAVAPGDLLDGATSYALTAQYKYVSVQSDGSNWWVVANN